MNTMRNARIVFSAPCLISLLSTPGCDVPQSHSTGASSAAVPSSDATPPGIVSVSPEDRANGLELNTTIAITFSETMDSETINNSTIRVMAWYDSEVIGTVAYAGATAAVTPSQPLTIHTLYRVLISETAADLAGNQLGYAYESYFSTTNEPSHLFSPVQVFPVGSWPEAVAIGDVNNDGKKDVVLLTSFNSDSANDFHIFVFSRTNREL